MTFLELVQKTWLKCALTGTGPTATASQTDMNGRIVAYVEDAYQWIQGKEENWKFRWKTVDKALTVGTQVYTYAASPLSINDVHKIDRILIQVDGRWTPLTKELADDSDSSEIKVQYDNPTSARPTHYREDEMGRLVFNTLPDDAYPIRIEYYCTQNQFADQNASPIFSADYHMVIVWKAVQFYAAYDEDVSLGAEAQFETAHMVRMMERKYLPSPSFGENVFTR